MFQEIQNRDAWSTIRGFVYQVDTTILRWIQLSENEILELEKGEDIDIITTGLESEEISRQLEQVKYREDSISLNQESIIEILLNFYIHCSSNPSKNILFRFVTNTNYVTERPSIIPSGESAIETWVKLANQQTIDENDSHFLLIKKHLIKRIDENIAKLSSKENAEENPELLKWKGFKEYIEDNKKLTDFIKKFDWSLQNEDHKELGDLVKSKISELNISSNAESASLIYSKLFLYVFKSLSNKGEKSLSRENFITQSQITISEPKDLRLTSIISQITERVDSIENKVNLHSSQIAKLVSEVGSIKDTEAVFNYRLDSISINVPAPIKNGSLRKEKVETIVGLLSKHSWVNIQGINGTGKTQLTALVSSRYSKVWWIDLRTFHNEKDKTGIVLEKFLSIICDCPITNNKAHWLSNALKRLPANSLIIINDLPRVEKNSDLFNLLTLLATTISNSSIKLLSTSNFKISPDLLQNIESDHFLEYYDLNFTDEEIIEILVNQEAEKTVIGYVNLIAVISERNPQLVATIIHYLKSINWGKNSSALFDAILKKEFSSAVISDTQSLIKNHITDVGSKELLYRLSVLNWNFRINDVKIISEVEEKIPYPNERLDDLINIWIQQNNDTYQISPLIHGIGDNNLPKDTIKKIHLAIGKSILDGKELDYISASRGILSFIKGEDFNSAGFILLTVFQSVKTLEEAKQIDSWGYTSYWNELEGIPKQIEVTLRAYITVEQMKVYRLLKKDISKAANRLTLYPYEDGLTVSQRVLAHCLSVSHLYIENISAYWDSLRYILSNWKNIDKMFYEAFSSQMFIGLVWFPIRKIQTKKDVLTWIEMIGRIETEFSINVFDDNAHSSSIAVLSDGIVNLQNQKAESERNWDEAIDSLSILIEYFKKRNLEILSVIPLKEIITIHFNVFFNQKNAEEIATKELALCSNNESKYHLNELIGKLYSRSEQKEKAEKYLIDAVELGNGTYLNYIDTLIYAAAIISTKNAAKAVEYCEHALELAKTSKTYTELDYIQVLGELSLAYWNNNQIPDCYKAFEDFVERLLRVKEELFGPHWIRLHAWAGHAYSYITAAATKDRLPTHTSDGGIYTKPYIGFFSFNTKDLSDLYKEENLPILLAITATLADAAGEPSKAYYWTLKAFDLARKNRNQKIFLMVSGLCAQYSVIDFKVKEALESYLLFSAASTHLQGESENRHQELETVKIEELIAKKPSEKWDAAEDITISYAITPLFIIVLNSFIENRDNKLEQAQELLSSIQDYSQEASNKALWETTYNLIEAILFDKTTISDLALMSNKFATTDKKNLQLIAILGLIKLNKEREISLVQIINIFPYLTKIYGNSKGIIKFALAPYIKNRCIAILKENFIGTKEDLINLISRISSLDPNEKNILQLIIQPVVKELDIEIPEEDRKLWLFDFKEI